MPTKSSIPPSLLDVFLFGIITVGIYVWLVVLGRAVKWMFLQFA